MKINRVMGNNFVLLLLCLLILAGNVAADKIMYGTKETTPAVEGDNSVFHRCLTTSIPDKNLIPVEREKSWMLPKTALAADFRDTINVLVLRYNFQHESVDDPNTTGLGEMNMAPFDSAGLIASVGHLIDPPPHNSNYFNAHMRALKEYYEIVSSGKLTLTWDVFPPQLDSAYRLPFAMSHYGQCDFDNVVEGLENYFRDAIRTADAASPEIHFADYQSLFLFHAGSDRQNDIGFPETCNDLFTGFIKYNNLDTVFVDTQTVIVTNALILPESASQDNRAVALNAVMAHEFGHQIGLVDLYSTATFMSQLGDFSLMDNNGFGTGIDFGFPTGAVFGAIPLYPTAWSRAYLGFVDVYDFRAGSDIRLAAAEMISSGIQVARIPISEHEYYLIENRAQEIDGYTTGSQLDSLTNVILGPAYRVDSLSPLTRSSEYDFLAPGSGVLIYHVDERVAGLDYNFDGENNFVDNQLQWARDVNGNRTDKFIRLVEADGFVNFGGFYRAGFGREEDMFRDDRNNSFTPNTNPQAVDNTGNDTHIYLTDIHRGIDSTGLIPEVMDTVIYFDLETDDLVPNFPVRAGLPSFAVSPIAGDIDNDGTDEIVFVSGNKLLALTSTGEKFLTAYTGCTTCPAYYDSSISTSTGYQLHEIPIYAELVDDAVTIPVIGRFAGSSDSTRLVVVGYGASSVIGFNLNDADNNGQADPILGESTDGYPIALAFGIDEPLYILTDNGFVHHKADFASLLQKIAQPLRDPNLEYVEFHGIARTTEGLLVMIGDSLNSMIYLVNGNTVVDSISLDGYYNYGPVLADLDRDNIEELIAGNSDGDIVTVSVGTGGILTMNNSGSTGFPLATNPIVADVDNDGYPDIVFGGINSLYAFDYQLNLKTSFPIELNRRFQNDRPVAAPIAADIQTGGMAELILPTEVGNIYSYGPERSFGFPLSAGEMAIGSPLFINDNDGGKLGYLGLDGWFYLWHVDADTAKNFWPMAGADPYGSYHFDMNRLSTPNGSAALFDDSKYYNYPNPVIDGTTTIRYYLGEDANSVELVLFDLNGEEVDRLIGPSYGMIDNEIAWDTENVTPGIYRCVITVEFNGSTETAFTDIAVIN